MRQSASTGLRSLTEHSEPKTTDLPDRKAHHFLRVLKATLREDRDPITNPISQMRKLWLRDSK